MDISVRVAGRIVVTNTCHMLSATWKISGIWLAHLASLRATGVWWRALPLGGSCVPLHMVGLAYKNPNKKSNGWACFIGQPKGLRRPGMTWRVVQNPEVIPDEWMSIIGHEIHSVSPCDFPQFLKIQTMFKEPTKAYNIFLKIFIYLRERDRKQAWKGVEGEEQTPHWARIPDNGA